jgi:putative sterol carrier protein
MVPPNWDQRYTTEYGFELEDIYAFGMRSVEMKWKATGYPLYDHPPGIYPFDPEMSHRERAQRQIKLLRAGVLGEPNGKPTVDEEVERILFEVIARSADTDAVDRPVTFQWKFKDAEPYYVRIDNGFTTTGKGLVEHADVTLKTSWADWVDVATRGRDARLAMLRGKIRPRGSLRQLARMPKIFPPRSASSRQPTASLQ